MLLEDKDQKNELFKKVFDKFHEAHPDCFHFFNQQQYRKRKLIINAGRRSGKSIWTLLSIANKYLPKEQYQKLVEDIEAEFKPMGERQKIAVMEVDDLDNWKSADEVFGGNK